MTESVEDIWEKYRSLKPKDEVVEADKDKTDMKYTVRSTNINPFGFLRNPQWIKTLVFVVLGVGSFIYMFPTINRNLYPLVNGLIQFDMKTWFTVSFVSALGQFALLFLIYYFTAGITFKILWGRLMRRKMLFHKYPDSIYDFITVNRQWKDLYMSGVGSYKINKDARGWLKNGVMIMPTVSGHGEGVAFEDVASNTIRDVGPESFNEHTKAIRVEERSRRNMGIFEPKIMMSMFMGLLIVGIIGYLLMGQVQTGECNNRLMKAQTELVQLKAGTTTTTTLAPPPEGQQLPSMK